jgi:hypothetical protein
MGARQLPAQRRVRLQARLDSRAAFLGWGLGLGENGLPDGEAGALEAVSTRCPLSSSSRLVKSAVVWKGLGR